MGDKNTPNSLARKKAIALGAVDARSLLARSLPRVLERLTPSQLDQVQKIMDAAVINPVIRKEADEVWRKIPVYPMGNQVYRDPRLVKKVYDIAAKQIFVTEADKRIRLDFKVFLTKDALTPTTDNPDEAEYLKKVRATLERRGVWLRISQPYVRDPYDPSSHIISPHHFEAWLSLGYDGDHIPTDSGKLDRDAILKTSIIAANYWDEVHQGPVQKALKREIARLEVEIQYGQREHDRLIKRKRDAPIGVAEVSDFLGGADLPSLRIWDDPHKLIVKALELNIGGNVMHSRAYLVVAAIATRNAAQLLEEYADKSGRGAGRAVSVLRVLKTAGEVAEIGLTITGVGGVVRAGVRSGGKLAASEVDDLAEKVLTDYLKKNPEIAGDLNKVRHIPGPKGSIGGRGIKPGQSSGNGTGWHRW